MDTEKGKADGLNEYSIKDLLDVDKVRELLEQFNQLIPAPAAILDHKNNVLIAVGWQQICTCFHRTHPQTLQRCVESDSYIFDHLHEDGFVEYKCKNGLWDLAYPIRIEGRHLATIFFGQYILEDDEPDLDYFKAQAEQFGFDQQAYLQALDTVPRFSKDYIKSLMNWAVTLAHLLAEQGLDNLKRKQEIAERKKVEAELAKHRDHLEILVQERTVQLTETNQRLQQEINERINAQKALNKEKSLIDHYLDSLPGLFYVFDKERFVKWNKHWRIVTGYTDQELSEMYGTDFFKGTHKTLIAERMLEVFQEGVSSAEADLITKSGKRIPHYFTGMRLEIDGESHLVGLGIDITDRRLIEKEKEKLIQELKQALEQVKQMSGLIPICANCKKIRDDEGFWNHLESYIEQHSDAQFSHGICEECAEELYRDSKWYQKKHKG